MRAHILPARQGIRWLSDSFKIYGKAQLRLPLIVLSYLALIFALMGIGGKIGILLIFLFDPLFSVSLSNLSRSVDQGKRVDPGILFSGFSRRFSTLLSLGALYIGVVALVALLSCLIFALIQGDARLQEIIALIEQTQGEQQVNEKWSAVFPSLILLFQLTLLLRVPPSVVFWHAAVLVAWNDIPKGKALFFGLVGCLRNWKAFLVYLIVFFVTVVLLPNLLLKGLRGFGLEIKALLALTLILTVLNMTLWFVGLYVSYRDIFAQIDESA